MQNDVKRRSSRFFCKRKASKDVGMVVVSVLLVVLVVVTSLPCGVVDVSVRVAMVAGICRSLPEAKRTLFGMTSVIDHSE